MTMITISGNLFDIYHIKDKMILWIKEKDGKVKRLEYLGLLQFMLHLIQSRINILIETIKY